jgi:hypothetical protein
LVVRRILSAVALLIVGAAAYRVGYPWRSPLTIVASAPQALSEQDTVTLKFDTLIQSVGTQAGGSEFSFRFRGDGVFDLKKKLGRMVMRGLPTTTTRPAVGSQTIFSGTDLYLKVSSCPTGALGEKDWLKVDVSTLPSINPTSPTTSDPRTTLDGLRAAGEVTEIGRQEINDIKTTRYLVKVDLDNALDKLPADQRQRVRATYENLRRNGLRTEAWLRDDGLPARFRMSFDASSPTTGRFRTVLTEDFLDYGKPVEIETPPEDEVFPVPGGQLQLTATIARCFPPQQPPLGSSSVPPPVVPQPSPS